MGRSVNWGRKRPTYDLRLAIPSQVDNFSAVVLRKLVRLGLVGVSPPSEWHHCHHETMAVNRQQAP
jgi:hypothetical protein